MSVSVYYLDDEEELCVIFAEIFGGPDVRVRTFTKPADLTAAFATAAPDLLVLDHRLPGVTGDQIARDLNPRCPVLLITGDLSTEVNFPFARVLHKPYDEAEVSALISSLSRARLAPVG